MHLGGVGHAADAIKTVSEKIDMPMPVAMGEADAAETRRSLTRYRVSDLMRGEREVILEHRGQDYRLRITEAGKLILSK
jgi:hemin uptake protein HemP